MQLILKTRNEIADENGISAHKVATNKLLETLVKIKPSKVENLAKIEDFAKEKADIIGSRFVVEIQKFCKLHNLKMDNFESNDYEVT